MSLRTLVGVIMVAFLFSGNAIAALTFTGTPTNSWAYFIKPEPSVGENDQYFVTSQSAYAGATFQGYVSDAPWGLGQPRAADLIFSTFVTSATTQQIPLILDGDDGHSLFVNNAFVGGGPFGADVLHTLNLTAGVPVRLDMAGFNGPGGWVFVLQTVAGGQSLSQVPGVTINATGITIPEPQLGFILLLAAHSWRRSSRVRLHR